MKAARIILVIALMPLVSAGFLNAGNTRRTKKTISAQEIVQEPTQTETSVETPESNEPTLLSEQNPVESGKVEQTEVTSTEEGIPAQPSEEYAKTEIQAMPFTDAANPSETFQFPLVKTLGGLGVVLCLMIALIF